MSRRAGTSPERSLVKDGSNAAEAKNWEARYNDREGLKSGLPQGFSPTRIQQCHLFKDRSAGIRTLYNVLSG